MTARFIPTGRRRGFHILVAALVLATSAAFDARPATAQVAVDELELRLPLRRGVAAASEIFHAANPSAKPAQVTISIQDWDRSEGGENRYYPLGTLPTSCGSRIKVFPSVLQLDAQTAQTVRVALDSGEALPHGCYAILFVETPQPPRSARGDAVTYSLRYGVKVYVEPEGAPSAELDDVFLEREARDSAAKRMVISYRNTGTRQTMAHGKVEIRRTDNTLVSTLDIPEFPTLPGATRRLGVPLPRLPRGKYVLLALLDYEGSEIAAGQVDLEIP
jgi:P pilus assembly chaperone PapD